MVSMVISEKEKKDNSVTSILDDRPQYPYGLSINLGPDEISKLGLDKMPQAGDKLGMMANVTVSAINMENNQGDDRKFRMTLQITDMEIEKGEKDKSIESSIYGSEV